MCSFNSWYKYYGRRKLSPTSEVTYNNTIPLLYAGKNINYLFPIQAETFDYIYDGLDLIAQASKCGTWNYQFLVIH